MKRNSNNTKKTKKNPTSKENTKARLEREMDDEMFERFWDACTDRIAYAEKHVDGEASYTTDMIAIAYEAAKLIHTWLRDDTPEA